MYTNNRDAYRKFFYVAWQKYQKKLPLEPIEVQLVDLILWHPDYHQFLEHENDCNQEFTLEENPFFHMSLHLAIRDQIQTRNPSGIEQIYQELINKYGDAHFVEHKIMSCLQKILELSSSQNSNMFDAKFYLTDLRNI